MTKMFVKIHIEMCDTVSGIKSARTSDLTLFDTNLHLILVYDWCENDFVSTQVR